MERQPLADTTLFRVVAHKVYINENKEEQHFPCEYKGDDNYLEWTPNFRRKLKEFDTLEVNADSVVESDADGVEVVLWACSVSTEWYNSVKDLENFDELVNYKVDYRFTEILVKYKKWQEIADLVEVDKL